MYSPISAQQTLGPLRKVYDYNKPVKNIRASINSAMVQT